MFFVDCMVAYSKKIAFHIQSVMKERPSSEIMFIFGVFSVIHYPIIFLIAGSASVQYHVIEIILRGSIVLLCLPLCFISVWPKKAQKYTLFYWFFCIIYSLPFFATYMFVEYAGLPPWSTKIAVALLWLVLITNWVQFVFCVFIGVASAVLIHSVVFDFSFAQSDIKMSDILNAFWILIIASMFARRRDIVQHTKQQSLKMQGGAIAHEMRTPLSAIQFVARGLQQKLKPIVEVEAHDGAEAKVLPRLSEKDRRFLARAPEELTYISKSAMNVIDMLLVNLQNPSAEVATEILSIRSCVESALEEYALSDEERHLITAAMLDDFQIKANGRLLKHVFFNLLKNALHYIKDVPEGRIEIWTTVDKAEHTLHFRDTGKGIAKKSLPHIFDHFYSRTDHGTGLGLAFCKMTMKSLGGDITCRSVEGQFTHCILTFPLIREDQIKASSDSETAR